MRLLRIARRTSFFLIAAALIGGAYWLGSDSGDRVTTVILPADYITIGDGEAELHRLRLTDGSRTLIFLVLSVTCAYCDENLANWVTLVDAGMAQTHPGSAIFQMLTPSALVEAEAYLAPTTLAHIPVIRAPRSVLESLGVTHFPSTIVARPGAGDLLVWNGVLTREDVRNIRSIIE